MWHGRRTRGTRVQLRDNMRNNKKHKGLPKHCPKCFPKYFLGYFRCTDQNKVLTSHSTSKVLLGERGEEEYGFKQRSLMSPTSDANTWNLAHEEASTFEHFQKIVIQCDVFVVLRIIHLRVRMFLTSTIWRATHGTTVDREAQLPSSKLPTSVIPLELSMVGPRTNTLSSQSVCTSTQHFHHSSASGLLVMLALRHSTPTFPREPTTPTILGFLWRLV